MRNSSDTECMIILLVLIGIVALLSFYTVVICTGLLVYHVSAGWQETLQVVSALCILWFFLFVIIVGLLVVFWICIQRRSTRKQGFNTGPYWHLVPLTRFDVDFQKLVNLDTLIPLLNQGGILSPVELRELYVVHRSESWRISYLLSLLDRKGKQGIKALIFALKSDEEHMGHQELGAHLEEEYCKSKAAMH